MPTVHILKLFLSVIFKIKLIWKQNCTITIRCILYLHGFFQNPNISSKNTRTTYASRYNGAKWIKLLVEYKSIKEIESVKLRKGAIWSRVYISCHTLLHWLHIFCLHMRTCVPEAGIKGRDKQLHPTISVGCNYLSCKWYLPLAHTFSYRQTTG